MDPAKFNAIHSWPRHTLVTKIQSFIRMAGYYRWFLESFSVTATLLTHLTYQGVSFVWFDEWEASFQRLKELLITATILALSVEGESFVVYYDTSHVVQVMF